jgi:phosphoglycerate dehydrogenase-like enzyme
MGRKGVGMGLKRVIFFNPFLSPTFSLLGRTERVSTLREFFCRFTVVTLHAPLPDKTQNVIGAKELAQPPKGAILVNTARGSLVDLDA